MEDGLRVLIIADDSLARAGLGVLLSEASESRELNLVGLIDSAAAGVDLVETFFPEVILWDLGWDPSSVLDLVSDVAETVPPILALVPDTDHVPETWATGCRGVLPRNVGAERLSAALAAAAQGLVVGQPEFSAFPPPLSDQAPAPPVVVLTNRENEVLLLLAEGLANKAIAARLNLSEHTVKFHVNAIMGKLGAQSRTEAVTRATRAGLILL